MSEVEFVPVPKKLGSWVKLWCKFSVVEYWIVNTSVLVFHVGEQTIILVELVALKLVMVGCKRIYTE